MSNPEKTSRYGMLMLLLLIAESVLILLSWILSAMRVDGVRSLLSGEGVRLGALPRWWHLLGWRGLYFC
jgi:hypothetical protein